jgi:hypothetical protein
MMQNIKDRLIELIDTADEECKHSKSCKSCGGYGKGSLCRNYNIADSLITHGVTFKDVPDTNVGEWISVKDRLPASSGYYLTYYGGVYQDLSYSTKHKLFNTFDDDASERAKRYHVAVTHWMPLPKPPKGE